MRDLTLVIRFPEISGSEKEEEATSERIMAKNFPDVIDVINPQIQPVQQFQTR